MIRPAADELLAELLISAQGNQVDFVLLRAVIEEASEAGASRALASLGLEDARARRDMDELRELLGTWRDVKKSAWQTAARWFARVVLASLVCALAFRLNLQSLLEP